MRIRQVPDELHVELQRRARAAGTSVSAVVIAELSALCELPRTVAVLRRAAARSGGVTTDAVIAAVRSAREPA